METPCKNICHLNAITGLCEGCGRSGAEIATWIRLSPQERRAIMAQLPARLAQDGHAAQSAQSVQPAKPSNPRS